MKIVKYVILYGSLFIIGVLAIPVCVFVGAIMILWTMVDKVIRKLE